MKWENDLLKREEESTFLISYLTNRYIKEKNKTLENKSFVLNINASWGSGKTYFLKNLALELKSKNYTVVEFDAWKNDYTKEPLLAFISELNNSLESFFSPKQKKAKSFLKNLRNNSLPILMSILSRKLTGYTLDELVDEA
jgi:predicted KAP-like P-loop ATPase